MPTTGNVFTLRENSNEETDFIHAKCVDDNRRSPGSGRAWRRDVEDLGHFLRQRLPLASAPGQRRYRHGVALGERLHLAAGPGGPCRNSFLGCRLAGLQMDAT